MLKIIRATSTAHKISTAAESGRKAAVNVEFSKTRIKYSVYRRIDVPPRTGRVRARLRIFLLRRLAVPIDLLGFPSRGNFLFYFQRISDHASKRDVCKREIKARSHESLLADSILTIDKRDERDKNGIPQG